MIVSNTDAYLRVKSRMKTYACWLACNACNIKSVVTKAALLLLLPNPQLNSGLKYLMIFAASYDKWAPLWTKRLSWSKAAFTILFIRIWSGFNFQEVFIALRTLLDMFLWFNYLCPSCVRVQSEQKTSYSILSKLYCMLIFSRTLFRYGVVTNQPIMTTVGIMHT